MSSRNRYKKCELASLFGEVLPTEKSLVVSIWAFFLISRQPRRIRKNRNHQKYLLMQGYLSKICNSPSCPLIQTMPRLHLTDGFDETWCLWKRISKF